MQLSKFTEKVLKNFASINNGIVINTTPQGQNHTVIRTVNQSRNIYVKATVPEVFENNVVLHELNTLLQVLSSMESPEIEFKANEAVLSEGGSSVRLLYASIDMINFPAKDIESIDGTVSFDIKQVELEKLLKFADILGLPELRLEPKAGKLIFKAGRFAGIVNTDQESTNSYNLEVADYTEDRIFGAVFKREYLKMVPGDYSVKISDKGLSQWTLKGDNGEAGPISYFIALDKSSNWK